MRAFRLFLISFLVLFLQVALIRWMPAYVRLLSYFSNFILLAAFLGIGIGCLLTRHRSFFAWFAPIQALVIGAVHYFRLEVSIAETSSIYFTSGTSAPVTLVESTALLPVLFIVVAVLFATLAQTMGKALGEMPPLRAYAINLAGSLAGVAVFALISFLQLPPVVWFGLAFASAVPFLFEGPKWAAAAGIVLLGGSLVLVHQMSGSTLWSPYYKITTSQQGQETVVEVNNIFHQSMAPVRQKEYFYQWPYTVFGDGFEDVLILGAGSGTDVAASLMHGTKRIDAVEIDPVIVSLGRQHHPDKPYSDPHVNVVTDDARHFLRTTEKKYDLVVFALIDSLTLQSSFTSVRLESYMFTEESFRSVRERLKPNGVLVIYNYFRERWLVDRLANTAAVAFGQEPRVFVHQEHAYLGVLMVGPGVSRVQSWPPIPDKVAAYNHPDVVSPGRLLERDRQVIPATDDWPFLYMRGPHVPRHYLIALGLVLAFSVVAVRGALGRAAGRFSWHFFFLGVGFMLLETKSIIQFALLWGSTWIVASLAIAAVLVMAMAATWTVSRVEVRRSWGVGAVLLALLGASYLLPVGRLALGSLTAESIVYAALMFSPIYCAGLLFGSSLKHTADVSAAFGSNLLGAMVGGVAEYLSLVAGYRMLLLLVAAAYIAALLARPPEYDTGMRKRGFWLSALALAVAAFALSGPTRTPAQSAVWFHAGFDDLGPKNLYNFANRYAQSDSTWQTEHLPTGGWAGSGGAHVRIFGCPKGAADCNTSQHQMNVGWQTPPIGMPLGRPWKLGDEAFIRFRIRFDPDTVFPTEQFGAKFILWGQTRTTPNSRWIIHLMPPYSNQGCTLAFESYSHAGWKPPAFVWREASDWKLPSFRRDASNQYAGFSSNVNIGWNCMPAILVHASNRTPVAPQRRGATPVDGWYHLQFQAVSGADGEADFRAWANNNDRANPSTEHVDMRRDAGDGDGGGLGVTGWDKGVAVVGYWGTSYEGSIGFVIDDFEIGAAFDPGWYPAPK